MSLNDKCRNLAKLLCLLLLLFPISSLTVAGQGPKAGGASKSISKDAGPKAGGASKKDRKPEPKPVLSDLVIRTTPGDCEVYINNNLFGRSGAEGSITVPNLPRGTHLISIRRDGYHELTDRVTLNEPRVERSFTLQEILLSLTIRTLPPQADVLIDGTRHGQSDETGQIIVKDLKPGNHRVRVQRNSYIAREQIFDLRANNSLLEVKLERDPAWVLAERVDRALSSGALINPPGNNAFELYWQLFQMKPNHPEIPRLQIILFDHFEARAQAILEQANRSWHRMSPNEFSEARNLFESLLKIRPGDKRLRARQYYWEAQFLYREFELARTKSQRDEKLAQARREAEQAIGMDPTWAPAYALFALTRWIGGDQEGALRELRRSIELSPRFALPYYLISLIYFDPRDKRKLNAAIEAAQKAIELDTKFAAPYVTLGLAKSAKGDHAGGLRDCQRAVEIDPHSAYAYFGLGNIYSKQKDYVKAEESLSKAIAMNPDNLEFDNEAARKLLQEAQKRTKKRK